LARSDKQCRLRHLSGTTPESRVSFVSVPDDTQYQLEGLAVDAPTALQPFHHNADGDQSLDAVNSVVGPAITSLQL